jgi:hypothetical protein
MAVEPIDRIIVRRAAEICAIITENRHHVQQLPAVTVAGFIKEVSNLKSGRGSGFLPAGINCTRLPWPLMLRQNSWPCAPAHSHG